MGPRIRSASRAVIAVALALLGPPAGAAPEEAAVVAVYQRGTCAAEVCGSDDDPVGANAVVAGPLQIHIRARATLGLEWVRLEAHFEGNPRWFCVQQWNVGGRFELDAHENWDSAVWPKPGATWFCDHRQFHFHGEPTPNRNYLLRVVAHELTRDERTHGDPFPIRISNAPVKPEWAAEPTVSESPSGRPRVTIRWKPNREDAAALTPQKRLNDNGDIVEYHFVRENPNGSESEFAVGATDPAKQGCQRAGSTFYQCVDDEFPATGYGGRYRYGVIAYRPGASGAGKCSIERIRCVQSELSSVRAVAIEERGSPQPPPVEVSEAGVPTPGASPPAPSSDQPVPVAPPLERSEQLAAAPSRDGSGPLVPVAAALLLVVAGWHAGRVRRARR